MSDVKQSVTNTELEELKKELEQAKRKLAEKESILETVFSSSGAGYWLWDVETDEIKFSDTFKALFGYSPEEYPDSIDFYNNTVVEEDAYKIDEALDRVTKSHGARSYSHDVRYKHKSGKIVEIYCVGNAVTWQDNGVPKKIIGTSYDITKLHHIHSDLKNSQTRLSLVSRGAESGIWDWDIKNNTLWWSPKYYEMLGYEPNEIESSYEQFKKMLHPDDIELMERAIKNHVEKNRPFRVENRQRHKKGHYVWLESTGQVLRDKNGEALRMAGSLVDITERKLLELELLSNQELLTQTSEIAMVGGWEVDLKSGITTWSDVVYDIYEVEHDKSISIEDSYANFAPESRGTIKSAMTNAAENGDEFDLELPFITNHGRHIWVRVIGRAIEVEGKIVKLSGVIQDITEKKLSEIQMEALTETLVYQNKQLEDYAHITSHNLRAPIANLNALVSLYNKEANIDKRDLLIEKFTEASHKLMKTVDELTEVLMIKTSELRKIEDLYLNEVIEDLLSNIEADINEKEADITYDFGQAPSLVYFKPYLDSILLNLLTNALKYSSPERKPKIHLESYNDHGEIVLTIEDNGLGINLDRHGDKLFKLHKTFHRQADSRGLGLYIVKNQIEVMGGTIDCESEEGKGTKFTIRFSKNLPEHIR